MGAIELGRPVNCIGDAILSYLGDSKDTTPPESPIAKMDPFSTEGELINIHTHFYQSQYQEVIDFDTSSLSPENALPARVLQLRARLALGQAEDVLADVKGETVPDLEAVGALAEYTLGKTDSALKTIEKLASSAADNVTVLVVGGTVLQAAGKSEEALALLSQHQGSCTICPCHTMPSIMLIPFYSGRRRSNSSDPPATEPNRSRPERSHCCAKMGARQSFSEPG